MNDRLRLTEGFAIVLSTGDSRNMGWPRMA
jgi:hypothetical protein